MTTWQLAKLMLGLVSTEIPLVLASLACVLGATLVDNIIPDIQGRIFSDLYSVSSDQRLLGGLALLASDPILAKFFSDLFTYLYCLLTSMVLSAVRSQTFKARLPVTPPQYERPSCTPHVGADLVHIPTVCRSLACGLRASYRSSSFLGSSASARTSSTTPRQVGPAAAAGSPRRLSPRRFRFRCCHVAHHLSAARWPTLPPAGGGPVKPPLEGVAWHARPHRFHPPRHHQQRWRAPDQPLFLLQVRPLRSLPCH